MLLRSRTLYLVLLSYLSITRIHLLYITILQGVLDRFTQIKPKVIFSVEAVKYNNKVHDHLSKLKAVVAGLPDLRRVVLFQFCGTQDINTADIPNW